MESCQDVEIELAYGLGKVPDCYNWFKVKITYWDGLTKKGGLHCTLLRVIKPANL